MHRQGDYELVVFEIPAHTSQKPHYHRHGIIDIFIVQDGEGLLHLSKIRDGVPDPASCEVHPLKAGDTYALSVGTLHAIETKDQRIVVMNIAQPTHSAYVNASDDSAIDIVFP
ncbi:RmlC-like cupin domain containing protein [Synechococcus sp. PROS-7-1]|nr:RmlC-like cupin domain containing protein [Synechococcus sp. PROS-7-1]